MAHHDDNRRVPNGCKHRVHVTCFMIAQTVEACRHTWLSCLVHRLLYTCTSMCSPEVIRQTHTQIHNTMYTHIHVHTCMYIDTLTHTQCTHSHITCGSASNIGEEYLCYQQGTQVHFKNLGQPAEIKKNMCM